MAGVSRLCWVERPHQPVEDEAQSSHGIAIQLGSGLGGFIHRGICKSPIEGQYHDAIKYDRDDEQVFTADTNTDGHTHVAARCENYIGVRIDG